jgi:hypothetical protein
MSPESIGGVRSALAWLVFPLVPAFLGNAYYQALRRFNVMQSPIQWEESLGRCVRGDRFTGGRKAAREEATGPSQKRRMARAIRQAIVSRAPTGRVKTGLFEAQS